MNPDQLQNQNRIEGISQPRTASRRAALMAGGGLGLAALLGGAAYVASKSMTPPTATNDGEIMLQGGSAGVAVGSAARRALKAPNIKNAPEIPATPPDVQGIFQKREDNSLFIGTGNITLAIPASNTSGGQMSAKTDGPEIEVVITRNTQIYKDTTPITFEAIESGKEIQQKVELIGSLDELADQLDKASGLSVWGARNGDRTVAQIVLYQPPAMISAAPSK